MNFTINSIIRLLALHQSITGFAHLVFPYGGDAPDWYQDKLRSEVIFVIYFFPIATLFLVLSNIIKWLTI